MVVMLPAFTGVADTALELPSAAAAVATLKNSETIAVAEVPPPAPKETVILTVPAATLSA
ncbi:MAG: hypothetical protein DMD87_05305 [Candidatus Rokuibacteriota bacterium]|nr:MAG: hypothetical protein DMD87_05305 [Candidatus Rokubacteria bacterium]